MDGCFQILKVSSNTFSYDLNIIGFAIILHFCKTLKVKTETPFIFYDNTRTSSGYVC